MHTLHLAIHFCLLKNFYAGIFQGDTIFRDTVFRDIILSKTLFHLGIFFFIWVYFFHSGILFSEILGIAFSVGARSTEWTGGRDSLVPMQLTSSGVIPSQSQTLEISKRRRQFVTTYLLRQARCVVSHVMDEQQLQAARRLLTEAVLSAVKAGSVFFG